MAGRKLQIETRGLGHVGAASSPASGALPGVLLFREWLSPKKGRPSLTICLPQVKEQEKQRRSRVMSGSSTEPPTPSTPMSPLSATMRQMWRQVVDTPRSLLRRNRAAAWKQKDGGGALPRVIPQKAQPVEDAPEKTAEDGGRAERHTVPGTLPTPTWGLARRAGS